MSALRAELPSTMRPGTGTIACRSRTSTAAERRPAQTLNANACQPSRLPAKTAPATTTRTPRPAVAHLSVDQEIYEEYRRGPWQQLAERHVVGVAAQEAASYDVDVARGPEIRHQSGYIPAKQVEERVVHRAGIGAVRHSTREIRIKENRLPSRAPGLAVPRAGIQSRYSRTPRWRSCHRNCPPILRNPGIRRRRGAC